MSSTISRVLFVKKWINIIWYLKYNIHTDIFWLILLAVLLTLQRQEENKIKTTECYTHSSLKVNLPTIHSKKNLKPPETSGFNRNSASSCPLCQFFLPKTRLKSETALHWSHHTLEKNSKPSRWRNKTWNICSQSKIIHIEAETTPFKVKIKVLLCIW